MALAAIGNLALAAAISASITSPYPYLLGLGLVGLGGNGPFIASFHFASLFERQGVRIAFISGSFNVSAYLYLLLNTPIHLPLFFSVLCVYSCLVAGLVCLLFPDVPYVHGRTFVISAPSCCHTSPRASHEVQGRSSSDGTEGIRSTFSVKGLARAARGLACVLGSTEFGEARVSLKEARFWGFCLTFSWASLVQQWSFGALVLIVPKDDETYNTW
eukprot:CAMPEP_0119314784 /NCGR_PEP_ID=MMETSP1333-20130426/34028_1 /TAXON_ID=418940 /ORGANISM="Scyphosphaera apsteinii, Strain RCC1455" /LENGTH=215 /DNA_ID=CAMNT_0007319983 /DNA_START=381 /DNA_END=1025 /DNA_ORIENTATION=-